MQYTHIRNATALLRTGGVRLLIDPWFAPQGSGRSFGGTDVRSPIVSLPMEPEAILEGVDAVLLTHRHEDHFDEAARNAIPRNLPVLLTEPDAGPVAELGFTDITVLQDGTEWRGLTFKPTIAEHGPKWLLERLGPVSGYVVRAAGEPAIYLASDTIMIDAVRDVILNEVPGVVVLNAGGAFLQGKHGPIIMEAPDVMEAANLARTATVIAVHLEATDHGRVTRTDIRDAAARAGVTDRVSVPADGETLTFGDS